MVDLGQKGRSLLLLFYFTYVPFRAKSSPNTTLCTFRKIANKVILHLFAVYPNIF